MHQLIRNFDDASVCREGRLSPNGLGDKLRRDTEGDCHQVTRGPLGAFTLHTYTHLHIYSHIHTSYYGVWFQLLDDSRPLEQKIKSPLHLGVSRECNGNYSASALVIAHCLCFLVCLSKSTWSLTLHLLKTEMGCNQVVCDVRKSSKLVVGKNKKYNPPLPLG